MSVCLRIYSKRTALTLIAIFFISGCDFIYLHYSDCAYYNGPRFDRNSLNQPVLNQQYFDRVRVSFDGDGHIDDYDYRFEFSGSLPPGLSFHQDQRNIYFEGAAIAQGTYTFTVSAVARYEIRDRHLYFSDAYCRYRTNQDFLLTVDPV
jgi:hypothetical protein